MARGGRRANTGGKREGAGRKRNVPNQLTAKRAAEIEATVDKAVSEGRAKPSERLWLLGDLGMNEVMRYRSAGKNDKIDDKTRRAEYKWWMQYTREAYRDAAPFWSPKLAAMAVRADVTVDDMRKDTADPRQRLLEMYLQMRQRARLPKIVEGNSTLPPKQIEQKPSRSTIMAMANSIGTTRTTRTLDDASISASLENSADVRADQTIVFRLITSVAHQTACRGELTILEDSRHRVASAQSSKVFAAASEKRPQPDDEPACSQLDQGLKHLFEIAFRARVQDMELHSKGMGCRLQTAQKGLSEGGTGRVNKHAETGRGGQQLVQQLEPLRPHLCIQVGHACQVAAGPAQACNKSNLDRVNSYPEDDRDGGSGGLCRQGRRSAAGCRNHRHLTVHQFGRKHRQSIVVILCPTIVDLDVLALDVTCVLQPLPEPAQTIRVQIRRCVAEEPNHRHRRLLRPRRERPHGRAAEQRDELAAFHSITSSARASTDEGISMPSAFAVLRLMTNSYLVGACTGRSAGFSPFRMRST
jgi:hypothetical protein